MPDAAPPTTTYRVGESDTRPWGSWHLLDVGLGYVVKRIVVEPGQRLSLQKHRHRAEHWVVVNGTARVVRGEEVLTVRENESIFLPLGVVHRMENAGDVPLVVIEVQMGQHLSEDDIIRLEDNYDRT